MTSKAEKLLVRMRQTQEGWKRGDLETLYNGFGFAIRPGAKHDIVEHPEFPQLRTTLSRKNYLAKGYVRQALSLIGELIRLKGLEV
ncbi:MAG: hypothetical protein ABSF61_06600 [Anaerolineales bacterium]|jgi:hypothetical protein